MNTYAYNKCLCGLFLLLLFASFVGYVGKANESNFDKIETGMSMQQAIHILGKPTHLEKVLANNQLTLAIWEQPNTMIILKFIYDQVVVKNFTKTGGLNAIIGDDDFIKQNNHEDVENKVNEYTGRAEKKKVFISTMK